MQRNDDQYTFVTPNVVNVLSSLICVIYDGDISEQKEVLYRFEEIFEVRGNYKNQIETIEVTEKKRRRSFC